MKDNEQKKSRLSRWSQRKSMARKQEQAPITQDHTTDEQERQEALAPFPLDPHPLNKTANDGENHKSVKQAEQQANREAAEAVDLKDLNAESDFSIFMKDGVPEQLKKQALSLLWRSNPILANVDGLLDYDDDFNSPDLIMKTFKSAYQAGTGKGYSALFEKHEEEKKIKQQEAEQALKAKEREAEERGGEDQMANDPLTPDDQTASIAPLHEEHLEQTVLPIEDVNNEDLESAPTTAKISLRKRLAL